MLTEEYLIEDDHRRGWVRSWRLLAWRLLEQAIGGDKQ